MEVRVTQRTSFGDDVAVRELSLFAQGDDESDLLGELKKLFESRESDVTISIRVIDGLVCHVESSGEYRG